MHLILVLLILDLYAVASAFNVPQDWYIGLRENHTVEEHLVIVNQHIDIKQHIPEINGYAITLSTNDESIRSSIRQDPDVGFIIQKPQGFFSEDYRLGLGGYDLEAYEDDRDWLTLQDQDPEVEVTDDGATKTPLTWRIFFTDEDAQEEHIATVGKDLQMFDVMNRSYWVVFNDDAQEKEYLSMIKSDSRVTAVYPERDRQGIFYDEVEGEYPKPYIVDDFVIHKEL